MSKQLNSYVIWAERQINDRQTALQRAHDLVKCIFEDACSKKHDDNRDYRLWQQGRADAARVILVAMDAEINKPGGTIVLET